MYAIYLSKPAISEGKLLCANAQFALVDLISLLEDEHRKIRAELLRLGRAVELARGGNEIALNEIRRVVKFINAFVLPHLAVEEGLLLPALEKAIGPDREPSERMREDHEKIREEIVKFENSVGKIEEPTTCGGVLPVEGLGLIHDLGDHMRYENDELFPLARRVIKKEELESLLENAERANRGK